MIPLKLQLKNFLSYGPTLQTIDFAPYHLICLNGKNGHGKSALLDAITWAVWGQARKISGATKPDAHLLRLGQTQMLVVFEFQFNGQLYRIRREYAENSGKPYAALDFVLIDSNTKKAHPFTDKTIRATQEKIEQLIGLDFDSFVNSAFLRQGQSNEFSKKTPKERKDILASILRLNQYEQLRTAALSKIKQAATDLACIAQLQTHHTGQLQQEPIVTQQLEHVVEQLALVESEFAKLENEYSQIRMVQDQLQAIEQQEHRLSYELKQYNNEQTEYQNKLITLFSQWRSINREQKKQADISALQKQIAQLTQQSEQFQCSVQQHIALNKTVVSLKEQQQQIAQIIQKNFNEQRATKQRALDQLMVTFQEKKTACMLAQQQQQHLEQKISQLQQESAQHESNLTACTKKITNQKTTEEQFEKRKEHYYQWAAQLDRIKGELQEIEQKKEMTSDTTNPSCPLCEQNLSAARKRFLRNKLTGHDQFLTKRAQRLSTALTKLKKILIDQHKEVSALQQNMQEKQQLEASLISTREQLAHCSTPLRQFILTAQKNAQELNELESVIKQHQQELVNFESTFTILLENDPAHKEVCIHIRDIELQLHTLNYDQKAHEQTTQKLKEVHAQFAHYHHLVGQYALQRERAESISTWCKQLKLIKKQIHQLHAHREQLNAQKQNYVQQLTHEKTLREQHRKLSTQKEALLQQKGQLQNELNKFSQLKQEMGAHEQKRVELLTFVDDYQQIATACGKEGIQALLIEDALPEIEYEANQLLAQLTHNQAHIIIDSLRDLKKGGTKETLDIKISDPLGIRPYELFSGGEAFRIDFALRIAISKLLARRAGTSLQTLIIDEGFGSQDDEGIAHICDALLKIQDHFEKIIIVSHLPAMKDQFPVHFHIEKGAQGSTIQIQQQG
jgi:exonuclease SbcC